MWKEFEVRWKYPGDNPVQTSIVIARDVKHAKERVWLTHVDYTLGKDNQRKSVEFIEVEAEEGIEK